MMAMEQLARAPEWQRRPMTVGEILSRVWQILRAQLRLFVTMGLAPVGAMVLTYIVVFGVMFAFGWFPPHAGTPPPQPTAGQIFAIAAAALCASAPLMLAYLLYEAAATLAALHANRGSALTAGAAFRTAWSKVGRLVWLGILRWLVIALPMMALGGMLAAAGLWFAGSRGGHGTMSVGWIVAMVPAYFGAMAWAIWMALRLSLCVGPALVEDLPATATLARSARLTRGAKGRIFVVMLVVYLCAMAAVFAGELAMMVLVAIATLLGAALHMSQELVLALGLPAGILVFIAFLLVVSLQWAAYCIALAVVYDDQKFREQGAPLLTGEPA